MVPLPLLRPPARCVRPARRPRSLASAPPLRPLRAAVAAWLLAPPPPHTHTQPFQPSAPTLQPHAPTPRDTRLWAVAVYFDVLLREFSIVRQKLGARKAGFSLAFLTDAPQHGETARAPALSGGPLPPGEGEACAPRGAGGTPCG